MDCDGGTIEFLRQDNASLELKTTRLSVGQRDGCAGYTRLYEGANPEVVYRLYRVDDGACDGLK